MNSDSGITGEVPPIGREIEFTGQLHPDGRSKHARYFIIEEGAVFPKATALINLDQGETKCLCVSGRESLEKDVQPTNSLTRMAAPTERTFAIAPPPQKP